jgi:raffinose synthase
MMEAMTKLRWTLGLAVVFASGPAVADLTVRPNELAPAGLDVLVGKQALVERMRLEIKPRGADLPATCAWQTAAVVRGRTPALEQSLPCRAGKVNATLRLREAEPGLVVVTLDLDKETALAAEDGVRLTALLADAEQGVAIVRSEPWWTRPVFWQQQNFIPDEAQLVVARRKMAHAVLLPLAAAGAMGWARGTDVPFSAGGVRVVLSARAPWSLRRGAIAVLGAGDSPYALVAGAVRQGLVAMGNPGRLRVEKPLPEPFKRVGYCSWNSFYENQTSSNLMAAARSFADAKFPLGFFIIDAGWQSASSGNLLLSTLHAFEADMTKIPGGLKALVADLRRTTGAQWVGVWHSLQGTPGGVDPASPLAKAEAAHLWQGNHPGLIPDPTSSRGAEFFRDYYKYLRASDIDMVKVDFQNWTESYVEGRLPLFGAIQQSVTNFETAAKEAFGDRVINCMSMGPNAIFNLRNTNVVRNSLDYLLPAGPVGHRRHMLNNIFNSLLISQVAYPDFDMWESYGPFARAHSVLRALGGGPVYITGDMAKQDWQLVRRLILADGTVLRTDAPVLPTRDALFVDAGQSPVPLKGFARIGTAGVIGAFNALDSGGPVAGVVRPRDVEGIDGERFAVLEHFSRRLVVAGPNDAIPVRLGPDAPELFLVVPIDHGFAPFGLLDKYLSPRTIAVQKVLGNTLTVELVEGGRFAAFVDGPPKSVTVDGAAVQPVLRDGLVQLDVDSSSTQHHTVTITR